LKRLLRTKTTTDLLNKLKIEDAQKEKILTEIHLLKIQLIIAVLTAICSIMVLIVTNFPQLKNLIPNPQFRIVTNDNLLLREGIMNVSQIVDGKNQIKAVYPLWQALKWVQLEPGSYHLSVQYQVQEMWSTDLLLQTGKRVSLTIPTLFDGNIKVYVKNNTPQPLPKEKLDLTVDVTGNGFLWIYELHQKEASLIYPNLSENSGNEISVSQSYHFPDKNNFSIFAGENEGKETLLFVVTSTHDENLAREIVFRMINTHTKASSEKQELNWGVTKIVYQIKRP